jgi:hypothetical protein
MKEPMYSKVKVYAAVFEKDSDGNYILDTNGDRIMIKNYTTTKSDDDYTIVTEISEQYTE